MHIITVKDILGMKPCPKYSEKKLRGIVGDGFALTKENILSLNIPTKDKIWVLIKLPILSIAQKKELACTVAEHVLQIFETRHPNDKRPRECIEATRKNLRGEISLNELDKFKFAAYAAAYAADADAAAYAADAAAYAAAVATYTTTRAPYYAAAQAVTKVSEVSERSWQLNEILKVMESVV